MIRPSLPSSASRRTMGRNLVLDVLVAVGMGVTMALISSILPTVARRGGLAPIGLSALAAAPFVANLLGAFAGRFGPAEHRPARPGARARGRRAPRPLPRAAGTGRRRGRGGLLAQHLVRRPVPSPPVGRDVPGPAARPRRRRPRHGSRRGRRPRRVHRRRPRRRHRRRAGGRGRAGSSGVPARSATSGSGRPPPSSRARFSARESIRALRERPALSRIAVAQGFYGGGLIAASPLYALVHVDRLNLSLADVGVIGILTAVATTVAFPLWGLVADRFGAGRRAADRQRDRSPLARRLCASRRPSSSSGSPRSRRDRRAPRSTSGSRPRSATRPRSPRGQRRWPAGTP